SQRTNRPLKSGCLKTVHKVIQPGAGSNALQANQDHCLVCSQTVYKLHLNGCKDNYLKWK
ncbi:MAG: hypothetical protein ACE3JU_17370, partial [Paenibacillus sp.]|uniref:hypothetical protein n=1 Tax=Paenibacillus sp. TaxID=58172 RepID=UPI003B7E2B17